MNINLLEERIEEFEGTNLFSIFELIINAVKDYPLFGLVDTDLYFEEMQKLIGTDKITYDLINEYYLRDPNSGNENNIWVMSSLGSFLEALNLMSFYKIPFEEIQHKIRELS